MYKQIPLFSDKNHQETTPGARLAPPRAQQLRGLIKRQLREYGTSEKTKVNNHSLPYSDELWYFKRVAGNGPAQKNLNKKWAAMNSYPSDTVKASKLHTVSIWNIVHQWSIRCQL